MVSSLTVGLFRMNHVKTSYLQKSVISAAIAAALSVSVSTSHADIYEFAYANGGCTPAGCTGPGDGLFTMQDPAGVAQQNTSYPYYGDTSWAYGFRTQMGGTLTYDTTAETGAITISPFEFFNKGPATATGITFKRSPASNLMLVQMGFNWNSSDISTQVVLDASGLLEALPTIALGNTIDLASCTGGSLDGLCAVPASNTAKKGAIPIGAAPVATSSFNTSGQTGFGTVLADLSLGTDDGIGGSPMDNGPFSGFNANFDFASLTLAGYRETTPPAITVGGLTTNSITIPKGVAFDPLNPSTVGYVSCVDATHGSDTIDAAVGNNANISFQVPSNTVDINTAGDYVVTYTCQDNSSAIPSGTLTASNNTSNTATLNVTVNTTPVANTNYDQTLASNTTLLIDFASSAITGDGVVGLAIAEDADGNTMTFATIGTALHGAITNNGTNLVYTPTADGYVGTDSFTYTVNDGFIESATGTVNLTISNVLPVAVADGSSAQNSTTVTINLTTNDSDYEDALKPLPLVTLVNISATAQASDGSSVTNNGDGTVDYTAPATFTGNDTFTYQVQDSNGGLSNVATVTVNVSATPNAVPTANDVAYNTDAGSPLTIDITLGDDTATIPAADADLDTLIFTNVAATSAQGGTITGQNTGTLTYTPAAGYNGPDSFTFTANDGKGGVSSPANTINITVNQVAPVANDDTGLTMLLPGTLNIDVAANDSDIEDDANGTPLVTVTPGTPDNGGAAVAVVAADGTINFTPVSVGVESFTYILTDSDGNDSLPATVTVTVTAAPVTQNVALATNEDTALTSISLPDATIATDADGDPLTFNTFDASTSQGGTVTVNGANDTLTYTPAANFNGVDTFTFSVSDGVNTSAGTSTMTVTVAAVNDVMVCQNASFTTAVDSALAIGTNDLIGGCTDVDGTVTLASYTQPTNGVVTDDGSGNLTYTPTAAYVGADSFTFTASDGTVGGDTVYTATVAVIDDPAIHIISGGNFTMLDPSGISIGGATDVSGVFDEKLICNVESCTDIAMTTALSSSQPFFALPWVAHDIRVFGPGSYTFDTACGSADIAAGTTSCGGAPLSMTVANGQLGAHMLFDYGAAVPANPCGLKNCDIDVAVLWNYNTGFGAPIYDGDCAGGAPTCDATQTGSRPWNWVSVDGDANGFRGIAMVDGPFVGFHANFNLDMTSGYTPPVANNDIASTTPGLLTTIDLLANDSDVEDGTPPASATVNLLTATSTLGITLTNNGDGTIDYTPVGLIAGDIDTFQYTIADAGGALSNVATVTVNITAFLNTVPVANAVNFSVNEDAVLVINVTDVDDLSVAVASDVNSDPLTFATFDVGSTQGGTVTVDVSNTVLSYTPLADFNGTDTFTFTVTDGLGGSNVATMTITVNPVNDAVVCTDVTLATPKDTPLTIVAATDLITGCTDIDGDTVSFASAAQPSNAASTIADDGLGTLTYTPATGLMGSDTFVFTATDGNGGDGVATAKVQVGTVYGNFTMLDAAGKVFGGTNDVVFTWDGVSMHSAETEVYDAAKDMTIKSESAWPFFGAPWFAHHVRVFGPGTYTFETDNTLCESKVSSPDTTTKGATKTTHPAADDIDVTGCMGTGTATTMSMTVGTGQIGVHMLFDYNGSFDIDVVNVYDINAPWNDPTGQGDQLNDLWDGPAGVAPSVTINWGLVSTDVNGDGKIGSPMVDGPFVGFYANFNDNPGAGNTTDTDADGVIDASDAFPDNAAASVDADADGLPDSWNTACDQACIDASGLTLDTYPGDSNNDGIKDNYRDAGNTRLGGGALSWLLLCLLPLMGLFRRSYK